MSNERPSSRVFQLSLRGLFAFSSCVAVGMLLGAAPVEPDPYLQSQEVLDRLQHISYGLLGFATSLLVVELWTSAVAIRRTIRERPAGDRRLLLACRVAIIGRLAIIACLAGAMLARILEVRRVVTFPSGEGFFYSDVVTGFCWWLAVVIALTMGSKPRPHDPTHSAWRSVVSLFVLMGVVGIGLRMLFDMGMVTFLVHVACAAVDASHIHADYRYAITSDAARQFHAWASVSSVGVLLLSAAALVRAFWQRRSRHGASFISLMLGVLAMAACLGFAGWFRWRWFPKFSPDMAEAGACASWWHRLGGVLLGMMLTVCIAVRVGSFNSRETLEISLTRSTWRRTLIGVALVLAMSALLIRQSDVMDYGWEGVSYLVSSPEAYFAGAILVLAALTAWQAWRSRREKRILEVHALEPRLALGAGIAAGAWLATAALTLAAAQFLFWQGSWFEW
jgi:hypothetical protein